MKKIILFGLIMSLVLVGVNAQNIQAIYFDGDVVYDNKIINHKAQIQQIDINSAYVIVDVPFYETELIQTELRTGEIIETYRNISRGKGTLKYEISTNSLSLASNRERLDVTNDIKYETLCFKDEKGIRIGGGGCE